MRPPQKSIVRNGKTLTICFDHADGGGVSIHGDTLSAMKIEADHRPLAFTACTEFDRLVLTLKEDTEENLTVAFAKDDWYIVNLFNCSDIPAIPFEFYC